MIITFSTIVDDKYTIIEWKQRSESFEVDKTLSESILYWQIELDCREHGLKGLTVSPTRLDGTVFLQYGDDLQFERELDISKFEIEAGDLYGEGVFDSNSISITEYSININLNERKITVDFKAN